jgi:hypothetical protein
MTPGVLARTKACGRLTHPRAKGDASEAPALAGARTGRRSAARARARGAPAADRAALEAHSRVPDPAGGAERPGEQDSEWPSPEQAHYASEEERGALRSDSTACCNSHALICMSFA